MRLNLLLNQKVIVKFGWNVFKHAGVIYSSLFHRILSLFSYNQLLSLKEELEQKYLHLSQVYESEAKTKYQYLQQVEELSAEVRELRRELSRYRRQHHLLRTKSIAEEDSDEIKKIKKVQSLCRGWLYRQRWKRIVEEYIRYGKELNWRKIKSLILVHHMRK